MPDFCERFRTDYPGVYYIVGDDRTTNHPTKDKQGKFNKPERIYYIRYRVNGKPVDEKAGRQFKDKMTPAKANQLRTQRIRGDRLSNAEKRKIASTKDVRWTINDLWGAYKDSKPDLKGIVTDENRFQNHIAPLLGVKEPKDLSPFDVDRLRLRLLKKRSPQTVKNTLELLRRVINFGIKKRLCQGPGFAIQLFKVNNIKTEALSPEQIQNLLKVLEESDNIQVANLMKMALFTGMRRGELFNLKWEDIDFSRNFVVIRNPKGGMSQRIPLNADARSVLDVHPRTGSPYVFPGEDSGPRKEIRRAANKIKEAAGLPKNFRALHGLRHVYASILASSGKVDLYTIQKLLTHKSPQMTQRYAHLRDEVLRQASDLAGNLIKQQMTEGKEVLSMKSSI